MHSDKKLKICKIIRQFAAKSLAIALKKLLKQKKPISEIDLRDTWLLELRKNKNIFPDGWYIPPPHGITVLFATDNNFGRMRFKSLRKEESWPRNDIFLDKKNGFVLLYCSPVDRQTGIIGDFCLNIYFGKNNKIKDLLKKELFIIKQTFKLIKIGMRLSDLYFLVDNILKKNKLTNEWWISSTDPSGINYGHTVPMTNTSWSNKELEILRNGEKNWQETLTLISKKRKFINRFEKTVIQSGTVITLEPRVCLQNHKDIPSAFFHTMILFRKNGEKELLTNFAEIFKIVGMDYLI